MVTADKNDLEGTPVNSFDINDMLKQTAIAAKDASPDEIAAIKNEVATRDAAIKSLLESGDRIGSGRAELINSLEEKGDSLREAFNQMTPEQKAYGKLVGKLLESTGNSDIEDAFTWFEVEYDHSLSWIEKCLALFQAAETLDMNEKTYRGVRKIFNLMNSKN